MLSLQKGVICGMVDFSKEKLNLLFGTKTFSTQRSTQADPDGKSQEPIDDCHKLGNF